MSIGITIPFEVADGITVATMKEQYDYLVEELRSHYEDGKYLHPEDVVQSKDIYIPALKVLIPYFGGTL